MSLSIRDATPADHGAFAGLFPELQVPDPLPSPAQFEERMLPNVVMAEDGARSVGYAHWRLYGSTAHVVHVVVAPGARGRGVGRALLQELRGRARALGATRWYLNVKADNVSAIRLYERAGLSVEQRGWSLSATWASLAQLEGSTGAVRVEPSDEETSAFARRHSLDPERLTLARGRPGVVFAALREPGGLCALGVFDPAFPGVYPIAVAHPRHARPLLDAFLPHSRAAHVHLSVEGDAALADVLRGAGATSSYEFLRMGAPLA